MKSENQLAKNWLIFNVFNSFGLIDFVAVGCFTSDTLFFLKEIDTNQFNAIFIEKICRTFSYKILY